MGARYLTLGKAEPLLEGWGKESFRAGGGAWLRSGSGRGKGRCSHSY